MICVSDGNYNTGLTGLSVTEELKYLDLRTVTLDFKTRLILIRRVK